MPEFQVGHLFAAWILDAAIGDPPYLAPVHPIIWAGRVIGVTERVLHIEDAPAGLKLFAGALLWFFCVVVCVAAAYLFLAGAEALSPAAGHAAMVFVVWALLATGDLARQVRGIARELEKGNIQLARRKVSYIVGRDTADLGEREVCRAAFETAAENSSDGVVAPLFYVAVGSSMGFGPLLGVAYKVVNTLDSMVGYKNERYLYFGRFSARMDDLLNLLPARLTAMLVVLISTVYNRSGLRTFKTVIRDGRKHSSPNSGYPEAAFAGALGVLIGGTNFYFGVPRRSHLIGEDINPLDPAALKRAVNLLWAVSFAALLLCAYLTDLGHQAFHFSLSQAGL